MLKKIYCYKIDILHFASGMTAVRITGFLFVFIQNDAGDETIGNKHVVESIESLKNVSCMRKYKHKHKNTKTCSPNFSDI